MGKIFFTNCISARRLIFRIYKQLDVKNLNNPTLKWGSDLNREFSIEESQMSEKDLKKCLPFSVVRGIQINITVRWNSIIHLTEWLRSITQVTAHASKDMEQGELSFIAGGSANLHSHYGNQYSSSSENWESIYLNI